MKIPSDFGVTSRYVPQKATMYVRRKRKSLSDTSVTTVNESEWDTLRSSSLCQEQLRGCLKESLECGYTPLTSSPNVQWSCVDVYLHAYELGDHPCPILGPPTTISWKAHDHQNLSMDDFERQKRRRYWYWLSPSIREQMLLQAGYSEQELSQAMNEARRVRMSRDAWNKPFFSWFSFRGIKNVKTVKAPSLTAAVSCFDGMLFEWNE